MHSRWPVIGAFYGLLLGAVSGAPAHASVISIHTESLGMESLVDITSDTDSSQVADAVFQEGGDWNDSKPAVHDSNSTEEEPAAELFMATTELGYVGDSELAGVESNSAVPLPASVWLFGSGLLWLVSSIKRRKN